jgi:transcriptional regulator with XRE-family HTH domain
MPDNCKLYQAKCLKTALLHNILCIVLDLISIGQKAAQQRKSLKLTQSALAHKAGISRNTLVALEGGRAGELGFSKLTKLLAVLGLELKLQSSGSQRPTLDELRAEDQDDQSMDRRR